MITDVEGLKNELEQFILSEYNDNSMYRDAVFHIIDQHTEEPVESNKRAISSFYGGYNLND